MFELVTRILANVDAINTVANRLRISRESSAKEAVELHISTYRKLLAQISRDAEVLDDATLRALPGLIPPHHMDHEKEPIHPKVPEFSLSAETQAVLEAAKRAPLTVEMLTSPPEKFVREMVASVQELATVVQGDAVLEL